MPAAAIAQLLIDGLEAYAGVGAVTALAFLTVGISRVAPRPDAVTLGARLLLFPAAAALWPLILRRWLATGRAR